MKHRLILTKYFFRKNLKSILSFAVILLIATVMFASGLVITSSIDGDYQKKFDELNTADVSFVIPEAAYTDKLSEKIRGVDEVLELETARGIMLNVPVKMNDMEQNQNQIFYLKSDVADVSKLNVISSTNDFLERPIYIPYYLSVNSGLEPGDEFRFKVDDKEYEFTVAGVVEEMQYGNYASSMIGEYLPELSYKYLKDGNKDKETRTLLIKSDNEEEALKNVSAVLTDEQVPILNKSRAETKKQSRLSMSNILVLILLAFAIIVLFISLVVTRFKIKQTLAEDLANMGVLKSLGYRSREIISGIVLPYTVATLISSGVGILLSLPVVDLLGQVISAQAGFVWEPKLSAMIAGIILIFTVALVAISTRLSASKIKKLKPIEAIRGVEEGHGKRVPFPIAKTHGGVNFILALKNFVGALSGNVLLGTVLFLTTILASFVVTLFFNVNVSPENFINTLVEEHPTVMVKQREDIKDKIAEKYRVIYYDENQESVIEGTSYKTFVAENFDNLSNDLVYEGENPKSADEIAIGNSIQEKYGYQISDEVELSEAGASHKYKVTGFMQSVNNAGEVIEMTVDGYKLLDSEYKPDTLYIYLDDENEEKAAALIDELEEEYGHKIEQTVNYVSSMNSAASTFLSLIKIITIVIIAIALVVIYLVLSILLSSLITSKKQDLGVLKAVGFKTRQLIFQIVGGFMPSAVIFVALGAVMSAVSMSNIFGAIFGMVGAYKVSFEYPLFVFFGAAAFLLVSTGLIGIFLAKKIKRITVYSLIKE